MLFDLLLGVVLAGVAFCGGSVPDGAVVFLALGGFARRPEVERWEVADKGAEAELWSWVAEVAPKADGCVEGFEAS